MGQVDLGHPNQKRVLDDVKAIAQLSRDTTASDKAGKMPGSACIVNES